MAGAGLDPARPPRHWAPEAWRLRCAIATARQSLPYATADARLLDGVEKWLLWTGKGKAVPGPWWALALALVAAMHPCLADAAAARLVAPWARETGVPGGDAGPDAFRPLGS